MNRNTENSLDHEELETGKVGKAKQVQVKAGEAAAEREVRGERECGSKKVVRNNTWGVVAKRETADTADIKRNASCFTDEAKVKPQEGHGVREKVEGSIIG